MKDRFTLALVAGLALACGALGTSLFSSARVEAQAQRRWVRCFAADFSGAADGANPEEMLDARGSINIPPGWTPVGGTGGGLYVVLCR